jgi:CO/xanthine dehydrogenase Mo-binding subunit
MDPYEFRMKNLMEEGDVTLTGGHYRAIKANDTLKAAARAAGYSTAKGEYIGRGVAMGYRGPGGGTTSLKVELGAASSIVIQTSFFEQGTGTYTTLRQIVAEELGCDPEEIQIKTLDTDSGVSSDTGLGGSRGTRVASGAAFQAARAAKEELLHLAEAEWGWAKNDMILRRKKIVNNKTRKQRPWNELLARAGRSITGESVNKDDDHSPVTAFAAQVAEVAVDPETGEVTLRRLTTAHNTGVIMNPVGHQGQIDGGVVQGIGYGLIEHLPVQDGRVEVANLGEYKIPTIKNIPALKTVIIASGEGVGPYRVKGIGENPISPVAPAIANAIEDAVGVRIKDLPITAEKVYAAMRLEKSK